MPTNFSLYHHFFKYLHRSQQLILFLNFFVSNLLLRWTHFSLWILHPQDQMFFKWSAHQRKKVQLGPIPPQSLIQHSYQEQWQGRQSPSAALRRWNERSSKSIRIPMNPQFHMGLATNIQLWHPAWMISTYRPTHSMCWLLWPWFDQTKKTAPNHRGRLSRLQSLRPQWIWVPMKAGRQRAQPLMTILFIPRTSQDGSPRIVFSVTFWLQWA